MSESRSEVLSTATSVVSSVVTAAAGASGHVPEAVLVAGGASALQPILLRAMEWVDRVIRRGAERNGCTAEELLATLDTSAAKTELLIKAIELARSASLEEKREAIADALARGTASDEAAMTETEFLRILADLDVAHVEGLRILSEPRPDTLPRSALLGQFNFDPEDLGIIAPTLHGREQRILAVLSAHGLAERDSSATWDSLANPSWHVTAFGREVLARVLVPEQETPGDAEGGER